MARLMVDNFGWCDLNFFAQFSKNITLTYLKKRNHYSTILKYTKNKIKIKEEVKFLL